MMMHSTICSFQTRIMKHFSSQDCHLRVCPPPLPQAFPADRSTYGQQKESLQHMYVPLKLFLGFVAWGERKIPSLENEASLSWTFSKHTKARGRFLQSIP